MKILTVLGARPQFIKAAAISRIAATKDGVDEIIVHTGQHYDAGMSAIFFEELGIPQPAHSLGIGGGSHGVMTGRMLIALEEVIRDERPDWVLVYGDTNSTLAGALVAAKFHIPIAHVEAGLRSFNKRMPEEINRVLTDHCSDLLLTPTAAASANLAAEGIAASKVLQVGDVMFDVAKMYGELGPSLASYQWSERLRGSKFILATVHRQENTDDSQRLSAILAGLARVATQMDVVMPVHPRTRQKIAEHGLDDILGQIILIEPLGYPAMVRLQREATVIATDSGGVQKEAFFHEVPCVTLRDETEWVELIGSGWNKLVPPTSPSNIADAILASVGRKGTFVSPYGDGNAAQLIVDRLAQGA